MGRTLAEKIIARAAGRDFVQPGQIVTCRVDLAMVHDSSGPRRHKAMLEQLGAKPWDVSRIVVVTDHYVPAFDAESAAILDLTRRWVRDEGVANFYDMEGICHVILPERGHLRPGMFAVGGDSHSPTAGAWGCFMFGIGATEMCGVLVTGEIWLKVPPTHLVRWNGRLGEGVAAKDIMLALCRDVGLGTVKYGVVEYTGSAVAASSMAERMVLTNMSAELGAQTGIIAPDRVTVEALAAAGVSVPEAASWQGDADAIYAKVWEFDASALVPQVAAPHSPANAAPVGDHRGVKIDQCYIGACTGAKLDDLRMAASILRGRKVARGTRLLVAPASQRITAAAAADGTLAALAEAGAILMPSGCGACAGYGAGVLAEREVCLSSTARNFKGRMGHSDSLVYLGSAYTVAASAVTGRITDPRPMLAEKVAA
ncbi:MAG: 3-isopropylmalate dehydratase large subunit [Alphaproteobacteria bacterium]|nr:3-isopropylmalate dehydratase large subunit [Alphaproteobacteria bacterium]